ncbi:hypothetical protein HpSLK91_01120 [Helicobacter pylori]
MSGSWTCGPFASACAIGLWFGSDASFNYIDEWLHRDEFKKEILNNINEVKKYLKESYKMGFDNSITKFSQRTSRGFKKYRNNKR